jgi:Kef-type K+ transport system membrane component KefB
MNLALTLTVLGGLFLTGLAADVIGQRTRLPRVTLLLLIGLAAGPSALGVIPEAATDWYAPLSVIALTMVAFLLGAALRHDKLAARGRAILAVSGATVLVTLLGVGGGLWLIGLPPELALVLGAIATATAPATTQETLRDADAHGPFADTVRGVVAVDDAWGMIVFALVLVVAEAMATGRAAEAGHLTLAMRDIGGALLLGLVLGLPAAYLSGRIKPGEPTQLEALGFVFLAAGLALWLEVSFLLTGMVAGAVVANLASHHERPLNEIEQAERPFLILFFLLAGAAMELDTLWALGTLGAAFVLLRVLARLAGGVLGGWLGGLPPKERRWIGPALLAQAGVAVGMALIAVEAVPQHADVLLTLTIGTTVIFELIGPLALMLALRRTGAARRAWDRDG